MDIFPEIGYRHEVVDRQLAQVADQLVRSLIKKASEGDVAAFRELMDSAFGKTRTVIRKWGRLKLMIKLWNLILVAS